MSTLQLSQTPEALAPSLQQTLPWVESNGIIPFSVMCLTLHRKDENKLKKQDDFREEAVLY